MKKMNYMKRWLLLALSSLCMGFLPAQAANVPMIDSLGTFESNFPPTDWKVLNQSGASSWTKGWNGVGGGSHVQMYANASGENDAWLITPQVQPVAGKSTLAFYLRSDRDTMDNTVFEILVSQSTAMPEKFAVVETITNTAKGSGFTTAWVKHTVDMSAYEGQNVFVAFRTQKNNLTAVWLDSVAGLPLAIFANDVNLKTISLSPDYNVFRGDARTLCVLAENRGNAEAGVTGTLKVSVNGTEQGATLTATKTIAVGKTDTLKFEYTFAEAGEYQLQVSVPADDNTINDTIILGVKAHPANTLVEDFHANKVRPPKDWAIYTNADSYGTNNWWNSNEGATISKGYVYWGGVNSLPKGEPAVRALITPQLHISDGDVLSFCSKVSGLSWLNASKPASAMKIYVLASQTTADIESFTDTIATYGLEGENAMTENWKQYTSDLSDFKDKNIFVAFVAVDRHGIGVAVYWDEVGGEIALSSFTNDARVVMAQMDNPMRYWLAGEKIMVHTRVENHGTEVLNNLRVSLKANGTEAAFQTVQSLAPGAFSDTLNFEYTIPAAGLFDMEVCVPEDQNNINNAIGFSFQAYPAGYFIEGFEEVTYATFPPKYWSCDRTQYGYGWSVSNYANNANAYRGNANTSTSNVGYKLITPLLHLTKTDSLCFYIATTSNTAEYAVLTSVNAKDWDTLGQGSISGGYGANHVYALQKFFFNDKDDAFFGNRYVAFISLQGGIDLDEVYGPMLASRENQFALTNAFVNPSEVAVAGKPFTVKAMVLNDGTQAASKQVTLYAQGEQIATAQTKNLAAGEYDTVSFTVTIDKAMANMDFMAELPEDASVFDNTFAFTSHIYQPEFWRMVDGFEEKDPFWMFKGNGTWGYKPNWNAVEPASGADYLHLTFSGVKDAVAVSPYMDLRYEKYEVSVDIYRDSKNPTRTDRVELGFGAAPVWENVVFIDSVHRLPSEYPAGGTEGWNHYSFEVTLSDMQNGFFMIHPICHLNAYGSSSYEYMRFDNLVIRPLLDKDAELAALPMPVDTVWGYDSVKMTLNAVLLNSGTENLTSAVIRYGVDDKEMGSVTWNGNLAAGKDTVVELSGKVAVSYKETLNLYAEVEATGDANPFNNRVEKSVYVKKAYELPFVANFENEDWNKDWQNFTYSTDVRQAWFRDTTGDVITAPFGKACANSASMDDDLGAVNPDNWLVTPGLFIKYSKAYLSFYVQASDVEHFAEKFQVLVSTRSNIDSTFFVPVHTQTLENDQLQHIVLELNGYRNEVIYVAFRHFDCTDQYRLLLDSVYVYDPQGYTIAATVNPAQAGEVQGTGYFLAGEEVSLTATANTGYYFSGWFQDGDSITDQNPYSFTCEGNVALEARFAEKTFAVTLSAGEGGSVNPSGTVNVKEGEDLTVSITANEGYQIEDVKVDNVSVGAVETYTFKAVAAAHSLSATFKKEEAKTFAITLSAGEGGSVNPSGTVNVNEGEDLTVSITANEGYQIEDVKVDGVSVGAVESYTFEAVAAAHSLSATFKKDVANESLQADMLSVQPNPFVSELRVKSPMPVKTVRMVNLQGSVVFQKNVGGASMFSFNLNLPDGMYIVLVETVSGQRLMQRVVKAIK